jgi:hypothetical protein
LLPLYYFVLRFVRVIFVTIVNVKYAISKKTRQQ